MENVNTFLENGNFNKNNSLVNILEDETDTITEEINFLNHSYYISQGDLVKNIKKLEGVTILSLNIQSLSAKFNELCLLLKSLEHRVDIICLQETWCMKMSQYNLFKLSNYELVGACCKSSKHGGLATYIHTDFNYEVINVGTHSNLWESQFIEVNRTNKKSKKNFDWKFLQATQNFNKKGQPILE